MQEKERQELVKDWEEVMRLYNAALTNPDFDPVKEIAYLTKMAESYQKLLKMDKDRLQMSEEIKSKLEETKRLNDADIEKRKSWIAKEEERLLGIQNQIQDLQRHLETKP